MIGTAVLFCIFALGLWYYQTKEYDEEDDHEDKELELLAKYQPNKLLIYMLIGAFLWELYVIWVLVDLIMTGKENG